MPECISQAKKDFWEEEDFLKLCESINTPSRIMIQNNQNRDEDKKIKETETIKRKISTKKYLLKLNNKKLVPLANIY